MSAANFLASADAFPEPMLLVTAEGLIVGANRAFLRWVGLSQQALLGRCLNELVEPGPRLMDYLSLCARSDRMVSGELALRAGNAMAFRCDGVCHRTAPAGNPHVLLRIWPQQDNLRTFLTLPEQVNQLNAEVAQREMAEESLRRQRETLQVTLASIGDAVIVTDAAGCITFMNPVAEVLTGWSSPEARNLPLRDVFRIVNERSREAVEDPVAKVLQTGGVIGLANHTVLLRRQGSEVPIDDSAAPIRLTDGELFGVVLIFRDITEQRNAERTRAWLAAIIESSDDAIVSKTLDGLVTSWNRGAERLFGYSPEEIVDKPITTIIPAELLEEERQILRRLRSGERVEHFDTVRVDKQGRRLEVSLAVSPIRDASGTIVGASKVARDISQRKQVENALREADARKDEFLATLAHELRNPLAPIRSAAEIVHRSALEDAARAACEIIQRQVSQMTHLVDELLDVARINSGRISLTREPLDLTAVLSMAIESCEPAFRDQAHDLRVSPAAEPLYVHGDRVRLAQVFSNILGNAIKYTPPRGRIEVTSWRERAEVVVSIRDTGIGIAANQLGHVFELFAQLDRSYERTGGGLGIGLTLSRRMIEMHDGRIEARSEGADKGSEFVVRLPATEQRPTASVLPNRDAAGARSARKVLIADDNQDAAMSLAMLIDMMGHETQVVHDGLSAVQAADEFEPDVAILDIGMPKLDGYEVARALARHSRAKPVVLVALTGWGKETDRQRALAAGFHHHLVKPVAFEELDELLGKLAPISLFGGYDESGANP